MMEKELEQLIQNRKDLIEVHKRNDFTDGIHALLTDLYPDTAHFIYELLQNAEDMCATEVHFTLNYHGMDFEHNGTKRVFNVSDIDAITNIGHNGQKKNDPTSIGKFGVGFKAVFAYTTTPTIHSGEHHFRIENYFVPVFDNVPVISTKGSDGVEWTKFSFPFNNPKKPPAIAYKECLNGLLELNSNSILFLQNIRLIKYITPLSQGQNVGYIELIEENSNRIVINVKKSTDKNWTVSEWLRYGKIIQITDEHRNYKELSIAIAYSLKRKKKTEEFIIAPVEGGGKTFIYFPAEKEYSGLRFHINAPFASTVARDSVRDCPENKDLIQEIAQLVAESLDDIKEQGLMNYAFFEVLPNNNDDLPPFYKCVFNNIYNEFQKKEYLPTKDGHFSAACNAISGPASISNLLTQTEMSKLFGNRKVWIQNAPQKNQNADYFIQSLNVESFSFNEFACKIVNMTNDKIVSYLSGKGNEWLRQFYYLCMNTYSRIDENLEHDDVDDLQYSYIGELKTLRFIRSANGDFFNSYDIFILPQGVECLTKETPIIDSYFVDKKSSKLLDFFIHELDVREYGPKIEIEKLLKRYSQNYTPRAFDPIYLRDMLSFAKYQSSYNDVDFKHKALFMYQDNKGELGLTYAYELYLGEVYNNHIGAVLAVAANKYCLWEGYKRNYKSDELKIFIEFVRTCEIHEDIEIIKQSATRNPQFYEKLSSEARCTYYGENSDYTIPNLEKILLQKSFSVNKVIWDIVSLYGHKSRSYLAWSYGHYVEYDPNYAIAKYSPNGQAIVKRCDSTLIYYLKKYEWIPNKRGQFFKPADIQVNDLHDEFIFDSDNYLIAALQIGSSFEEQNQKRKQIEDELKKTHEHIISDEDFDLLQNAKRLRDRHSNSKSKSSQELFDNEYKESKSNSDSISNQDSNLEQKAVISLEKTFKNRDKMLPIERELFGRIADSTKEEKGALQKWYHGHCQMCGTSIVGANGNIHFYARNIIDTQNLTLQVRQTTKLAWNSLCLCPNCAMKYRVCSRDLSGFYNQIINYDEETGNNNIVLEIILDDKAQPIHYVREHFNLLKRALELINENM